MEWYRKNKRILALVTCIFFTAGLILTLIGMTATELKPLGTAGSIIFFVSLVPVGVIWVLNNRDKKENETEQPEEEAAPEK